MQKKIRLGKLELKNNIFLAPLAGFTDSVFRELAVEYGAGLVYTEMVSAAGLSRRDKKTFALLHFSQKEKPIAVQLFGNKPEEFAAAAKIICSETNFDLIDLNMGCPVRKVTNNGSGSALMNNLPLAKQIIRATVKNSTLPVTVKFRSGWSKDNLNYLELGKICASEGIAAVCLHPRTRAQGYGGQADWSQIKTLVTEIKLPVIGSGDVKSLIDYKKMLKETSCQAVMLGRGAIGNPWLIASICKNKELRPTPQDRIDQFLNHVERFITANPQKKAEKAISEMRKFGSRYLTGFASAAKLRSEVNRLTNLADLKKILVLK